MMPSTKLGKWALVLAVVGIAWFITGPFITMKYRTSYPITDSALMPSIGLVLIDTAAVMNILAIKKAKEESWASIIGMAVIGALAAFVTLFVVGEGLGTLLGFTTE